MSAGIYFPLNKLPELIASTRFRPDLMTMNYIHGYTENQSSLSVKKIHDAYISTGLYNVVMLDWAVPTSGDYVNAVINQGGNL